MAAPKSWIDQARAKYPHLSDAEIEQIAQTEYQQWLLGAQISNPTPNQGGVDNAGNPLPPPSGNRYGKLQNSVWRKPRRTVNIIPGSTPQRFRLMQRFAPPQQLIRANHAPNRIVGVVMNDVAKGQAAAAEAQKVVIPEDIIERAKHYASRKRQVVRHKSETPFFKIFRGANPNPFEKHTSAGGQSALEAFLSLEEGRRVNFFDIEMLTIPRFDAQEKKWVADHEVITEFALEKNQVGANRALNEVSSLARAAGITKEERDTLFEFITAMQSGKHLIDDEHRVTLDRLALYGQATLSTTGEVHFRGRPAAFGSDEYWQQVYRGAELLARRRPGLMTQQQLAAEIEETLNRAIESGEILAGHNVKRFDIPRIQAFLSRFGTNQIRANQPIILDTNDLFKTTLPYLGSASLDARRRATGSALDQAHNALFDVRFNREELNRMMPEIQDSLQQMLSASESDLMQINMERVRLGDMILAVRGSKDVRDRIFDAEGNELSESFHHYGVVPRTFYRVLDVRENADGTATMYLFNPEDKLVHVITRSSMDELKDTFNGTFLHMDRVTRGMMREMSKSHLSDKARREYERIHTEVKVTRFNRLRRLYQFMKEHNLKEIQSGALDKELAEAWSWEYNGEKQLPNAATLKKLKAMAGRLKDDADAYLEAMDEIAARITDPEKRMEALRDFHFRVNELYGHVREERKLMSFEQYLVNGPGGRKINLSSVVDTTNSLLSYVYAGAKKGSRNRSAHQRQNFINLIKDLQTAQWLTDGEAHRLLRVADRDSIFIATQQAASLLFERRARQGFEADPLFTEAISRGRDWRDIDPRSIASQVLDEMNYPTVAKARGGKNGPGLILGGSAGEKLRTAAFRRSTLMTRLQDVSDKYREAGYAVAFVDRSRRANELSLSMVVYRPENHQQVVEAIRKGGDLKEAVGRMAAVANLPTARWDPTGTDPGMDLFVGGQRKRALYGHIGVGRQWYDETRSHLLLSNEALNVKDPLTRYWMMNDTLGAMAWRTWVVNKNARRYMEAGQWEEASRVFESGIMEVFQGLSSGSDPFEGRSFADWLATHTVDLSDLAPLFVSEVSQRREKNPKIYIDPNEAPADVRMEARMEMEKWFDQHLQDLYPEIKERGYRIRHSAAEDWRFHLVQITDVEFSGQELPPNREAAAQAQNLIMLPKGLRLSDDTHLSYPTLRTQADAEVDEFVTGQRRIEANYLFTDDYAIQNRIEQLLSSEEDMALFEEVWGTRDKNIIRQRLRPVATTFEQQGIISNRALRHLETRIPVGFTTELDYDLMDENLRDALEWEEAAGGRLVPRMQADGSLVLKKHVHIDPKIDEAVESAARFIPGYTWSARGEKVPIKEVINDAGLDIVSARVADGKIVWHAERTRAAFQGIKTHNSVDKSTNQSIWGDPDDRIFHRLFGEDVDIVVNHKIGGHRDTPMIEQGYIRSAIYRLNEMGGVNPNALDGDRAIRNLNDLAERIRQVYRINVELRPGDYGRANEMVGLITANRHSGVKVKEVAQLLKDIEENGLVYKSSMGQILRETLGLANQIERARFDDQLGGVEVVDEDGIVRRGAGVDWRYMQSLRNQGLGELASYYEQAALEKNWREAISAEGIMRSFRAMVDPNQREGAPVVAAADLQNFVPSNLTDEALKRTILNPEVDGVGLYDRWQQEIRDAEAGRISRDAVSRFYAVDFSDIDPNIGKYGEPFAIGGTPWDGKLYVPLVKIGEDTTHNPRLNNIHSALRGVFDAYTELKAAANYDGGTALRAKSLNEAAENFRKRVAEYADTLAQEATSGHGYFFRRVMRLEADASARSQVNVISPLHSIPIYRDRAQQERVAQYTADRLNAMGVVKKNGGQAWRAQDIIRYFNRETKRAAEATGLGRPYGHAEVTMDLTVARRHGISDDLIRDIIQGKRELFINISRDPVYHDEGMVVARLNFNAYVDPKTNRIVPTTRSPNSVAMSADLAMALEADSDGDWISTFLARFEERLQRQGIDERAQQIMAEHYYSDAYVGQMAAYSIAQRQKQDKLVRGIREITDESGKVVEVIQPNPAEDLTNYEAVYEGAWGGNKSPDPTVLVDNTMHTTALEAMQKDFVGQIDYGSMRNRMITKAGLSEEHYQATYSILRFLEQKAGVQSKAVTGSVTKVEDLMGYAAIQLMGDDPEVAAKAWEILQGEFKETLDEEIGRFYMGGKDRAYKLFRESIAAAPQWDPGLQIGLGGLNADKLAQLLKGQAAPTENVQMLLRAANTAGVPLPTMADVVARAQSEAAARDLSRRGISPTAVAAGREKERLRQQLAQAAAKASADNVSRVDRVAAQVASSRPSAHLREQIFRGESKETFAEAIGYTFRQGSVGGGALMAVAALAAIGFAGSVIRSPRNMAPLLPENKISLQEAPPPEPPASNPVDQQTTYLEQRDPEGYELRIRGRSRVRQPIAQMISQTLSDTGYGGSVTISERDDTSTLTNEWVRGMVASLLGG